MKKRCEVAKCCGQHYQRFKADGGMARCCMCGRELVYMAGPGTTKPRWTVEHLPPAEKKVRIDLGLDLARKHARFGVPMTHLELAAWCGRSNGLILQIERRALKKIRRMAEVMKALAGNYE